jgi:hypothetical protein
MLKKRRNKKRCLSKLIRCHLHRPTTQTHSNKPIKASQRISARISIIIKIISLERDLFTRSSLLNKSTHKISDHNTTKDRCFWIHTRITATTMATVVAMMRENKQLIFTKKIQEMNLQLEIKFMSPKVICNKYLVQ